MPVYNCQQFVAEAIDSILKQTFSDFEFIIIDDKSTDETRTIILSYLDPRIILITHSQNLGISKSINAGLELSRGKYIARMDGDDISMITRFAKQVAYLEENPEVVLCGTWFTYSNTKEINRIPINNDDIIFKMLFGNAFAHPTIMMRRNVFLAHDLYYDSAFEPAEDYDLWTKLVQLGKVYNIPESLLEYRIHQFQISDRVLTLQKERASFIKKRFLLSILKHKTEKDETNYDFIFDNIETTDRQQILTIIELLNNLVKENQIKPLFKEPEFTLLIRDKKRHFFRLYFQNQASYDFRTFFNYIKLSDKFNYFSNKERLKLYLKFAIFWKSVTSNLH